MSNERNPFNEELDQEFDRAIKELDDTANAIEDKRKKREQAQTEEDRWKESYSNDRIEMETVHFSNAEEPSASDPVKPDRGKKGKKKKMSKKKKTIIAVICIVLVLLLGIALFVLNKLDMIGSDSGFGSGWIQDNDISASDMDSIMDADSLNTWLKKWATNGGEKMHSKYVKNILLIGVDSKSKLSDSMILVSINERTHQINMVSFYRDSYTYIQKNRFGGGYFGKMNAAYGTGGPRCVVSTIENDYKIDIDDYALVDYNTFPKIIDSMGGIDVNVTKKEADYLNRTWYKWTMTHKKIQFHAGKMHMNGEHALMFCRIRKLDSDVGRTARQRRVILAMMNKFKRLSLGQMNHVVNVLLPNIKTDMSKREIMKYASQSLSKHWNQYKVKQITMPTQDSCVEGNANGQWIWIVDYELAANKLQRTLYGQSNIRLDPNRISPLTFSKNNPNGKADRLPAGQTRNYNGTTYYYYDTIPATQAGGNESPGGGSYYGGSVATTGGAAAPATEAAGAEEGGTFE